MQTKVIQVNPENINKSSLLPAAEKLKEGGVVAFPTETVYGLGAVYNRENALKEVFTVKGRPADNPLILHIWDQRQLADIVLEINPRYQLLMDAFWPGPLTLVFPKKPDISPLVTAGLETVAVRMPSHPVGRQLLELTGLPVAAPSANLSGSPSPTLAEHVISDFDGKIPYVIDSGPCSAGIESTVLTLTTDQPIILRPGSITREMLEKVLGEPVYLTKPGEIDRPQAPGMKYRHYAPKAPVILVEGKNDKVVEKINQLIGEKPTSQKVIILSSTENKDRYCRGIVMDIGPQTQLEITAALIYQSLRECDKLQADLVLIEGVSDEGLGAAIQNRLRKAAGGNVIDVT